MQPRDYQIAMANTAIDILREHKIVYFAAEERTGKTLSAILTAEKANVESVLVITKKNALTGWRDTLKAFKHKHKYTVTNYHQAHKEAPHDIIILDEAHNYISSYPKPGKIWRELKNLCRGKPLMYISATPYAQGPQLLYHQFALSSYGPWTKYPNFYSWFKTFGKPYSREINGIQIPQYDRCDTDLVLGCVEHLFITKTRAELGFEYEPEDTLHYIKLEDRTRAVYNELLEHNLVELKSGTLVCDTTAKLRASLHMLEGGTAKIDDDRIVLGNTEKVQYIKDNFGDSNDLVIMYNYIAEKEKLESHFKHASILQATSYAEGVDLHKYKNLVIYSQDFSTARHTQRRARQANMNRAEPINVHFLLVKRAISEQVYKTVSKNKKNFVDSVFKRSAI